MSHTPPPPRPPEDALDSYIGLSAQEAQERAKARGWTRVRELPPGAIITLEYLHGRINFTVENGSVTRAWAG